MLLVQSRGQNIFCRCYMLFAHFFWVFIGGGVVALFSGQSLEHIFIWFCLGLVFIAVFSLWLTMFNSGESKIIEYGIELDEQGISFIRYGARQHITWPDFTGFTVKRGFPKFILLKTANEQDLAFSYYTFSSGQRKTLFDYLSAKSS